MSNSSGSWWIENQTTCTNCNNYYFFTSKNFTWNNLGTWQFKFNASSLTGYVNNSLSVQSFTVEKNSIQIRDFAGNNSYVNRSDSEPNNVINISAQVWDLVLDNYTTPTEEKRKLNLTEIHFWVHNGTAYAENDTEEAHNGTHYYRSFNPTCIFTPGQRSWIVNVTNAERYKDNSTQFYQTLVVNIIGSMNNTIIQPNGSSNYTVGDTILLRGNITDDCNIAITDATVIYELYGPNNYTCSASYNSTSQAYDCFWSSAGKPSGWYNVTMKSSKTNYNNGTKTQTNAFFLVGPVLLENPTISPTSGGWGTNYTFSVTVTHYIDVNVCLMERPSGFPYTITECKLVTNPSNTVVTFTRNDMNNPYSCGDLKGETTWPWNFKFNATDVQGQGYNETAEQTHILERDAVTIIYQEGNETSVNRNGTYTAKFVLFVNDTDEGKAAEYIAAKDSPRVKFNITWDGTEYRLDGNNRTFNGNATYYFNPSCSPLYKKGKQKWLGYIAGDSCYKDSTSSVFNVTIIGDLWPNVTYPDGQDYLTQSLINVTGDVTDECFSENITNALVSFTMISPTPTYYECTGVGNYGNGTYNCTWDSTGKDLGLYSIRMNASNVEYYNNMSRIKTNAFRLWPIRPLKITDIIRQYTSVYRNNSFTPYQTNITVHVNISDEGDAGPNTTVRFYNATALFASCTANSTGWCSVTYDPPDTISPGNYTIWINATSTDPLIDPSDTNTTWVVSKGILYLNITQPINATTWKKNETMPLNSTTRDENYNDLTQSPTITVRWYNESALIFTGHNNSAFALTEQDKGWRLIIVNATNESYDKGESNVTVKILSLADVFWAFPANESIQKYPDPFNISCKVKDTYDSSDVANYAVNFSYKTDGSFIFNGTEWTNATGYSVHLWNPFDKGNITFKCNIGDNTTLFYIANASRSETIAKIWIKDLTMPVIVNTSIIPNASIEANLNATNITADVTDDYGVNETWARIGRPDGVYVNISMHKLSGNTYRGQYTPSIGGTHNVTVFARDQPPENNTNSTFVGYFDVWGKIYGEVNNTPESVTATGITQTANYSFDLIVNFTNRGPATAYDVNLSVFATIPLNYNESFKSIGTIYANQSYVWPVKVTVPAATPPQLITLTGKSEWRNPDLTTNSTTDTTEIAVSSNPVISVSPDKFEPTLQHDTTSVVGTMTIQATGNDALTGININWLRASGNFGMDCPTCDVSFTITTWEYLPAGNSFTSNVSVTIPAGQVPGNYWAYLRTSTTNAGYDDTLLNITIPANLSWIRAPSTFGTVLAPPNTQQVIGDINVTNKGNVKIPLKVYKSENGSALVTVTPTEFDLERQALRNLTVSYNIPAGQTPGLYYVKLTIRNVSADPPERITDFYLNVTDIPPIISEINVTPQVFEIIENVSIKAKITDNFAVDKAWINVTRPDDSIYIDFMSKNDSYYNTTYSSTQVGNHSLKICANDTSSLSNCTSPIILQAVGNTS
ncbi:MAG: hypothetical protein QXU40_02920, partial [Candidatus Pacearchaeota archaeon]